MAGAVIPVIVEVGNKLTFASAAEWPGWSRRGKGEEDALAVLAQYASRYAPVAKHAGMGLPERFQFTVVERMKGGTSTDFGVPERIAELERKPQSAADAKRTAALMEGAWHVFDTVARNAPATLRKGPRGGGRDRDQIVEHVLGAESAYAARLRLKLQSPSRGDAAAIAEFRKQFLAALSAREAADEKAWPPRYAARRAAWHALDHAWEMEDRSD